MPLELLSEPDWLARRRQHVTASDVARVFTERIGELTLWSEKLGKEEPEFPELLSDFGHAVEKISHKFFRRAVASPGMYSAAASETPIPFLSSGRVGASPDTLLLNIALGWREDFARAITTFCEHKSCDRVVSHKWSAGPDRYCWTQAQATLAVLRAMQEAGEAPNADLGGAYATVLVGNGYNPERDFRVYEVEADEDFINEIREWAEHFWAHHVQADVPPPPDGLESTLKTLRTLFPPRLRTEDQRIGVLPAKWAAAAQRWREIDGLIDGLDRERSRLKQELELAMADAELDEATIAATEAMPNPPRLVRRSYPRAGYEVKPSTVKEFRRLK